MAADLTATPGNPSTYKGVRAVVRHPSLHTYGSKTVDKGQVFMMRGLENDDRLVRLGFARRLESGEEVVACGVCGASFASATGSAMKNRDAHGDARHVVRDTPPEPRAPQLSDVDSIDENSLMPSAPENDPGESREAPDLYLDQTAAERGVKSETITL